MNYYRIKTPPTARTKDVRRTDVLVLAAFSPRVDTTHQPEPSRSIYIEQHECGYCLLGNNSSCYRAVNNGSGCGYSLYQKFYNTG